MHMYVHEGIYIYAYPGEDLHQCCKYVILCSFTRKSVNMKWNIYTSTMLNDLKNIVTYDIIQYQQLIYWNEIN